MNSREAQGVIVELVLRLVAAAAPAPRSRRFPLGDSIGQHGPDGELDTEFSALPWIPAGHSLWEIGTGDGAQKKATSDYRDLTKSVPKQTRQEATFIFVTPRSGVRGWTATWTSKGQARWILTRKKKAEWKDVRVIDGTGLIDWLRAYPAVGLWFARRIGLLPLDGAETLEQRWGETQSIGEPPPLAAELFLAARDDARSKLDEVFNDTSKLCTLRTRYPDQVPDFVAAHVFAMDEERRIDTWGRSLIVSTTQAWEHLCSNRERLVIVADARLDLSGRLGTHLLQMALRQGHAVVRTELPNGGPDPTLVALPSPRTEQVREALEHSGYPEQRARVLAQRSAGNLNALLRYVLALSLSPAWAETSAAADLVIAELLGSWNEGLEGDREAVEYLAGNSYGEWIGPLRDLPARPDTPLVLHDGRWRFISRYEGWYALGARVHAQQLERARTLAVRVLSENDPQFDLAVSDRFAAGVYGKVLRHSRRLRTGLAETLALMGAHPNALRSLRPGASVVESSRAVVELLEDADWVRWASLNDVLPLLAEAAPSDFLNCLDRSIAQRPEIFQELFKQEGDGFSGGNYLTGLLWALESLAWEASSLGRALLALAALDEMDPGGQWANRPLNSMRTILLPWMPQTCAPLATRVAAIREMARRHPRAARRLLQALLPQSQTITMGSHRPMWRDTIPDDWKSGVSRTEFEVQVRQYAKLNIELAANDAAWLEELFDGWAGLSGGDRASLAAQIRALEDGDLTDEVRERLWWAAHAVVLKHDRFTDAAWAMDDASRRELEALASELRPRSAIWRHRYLFSQDDWDLFTSSEDYTNERERLDGMRAEALRDVLAEGGADAVLQLIDRVDDPRRVGLAVAQINAVDVEALLLPAGVASENDAIRRAAGGVILARFQREGFSWFDRAVSANWSPEAIATALSYLPFERETWARASSLLGDKEVLYWTRAVVHPFGDTEGLDIAIERLLDAGRPHAALRCIQALARQGRPPAPDITVKVLMAIASEASASEKVDHWEIGKVIKSLQGDSRATLDQQTSVEWTFLALLDARGAAEPATLFRRLATEPEFFLEVLCFAFKPRDQKVRSKPSEEVTWRAENAYRLLNAWNVPPGRIGVQTMDADRLSSWLDTVERLARARGRLEVALQVIGQVLYYAPADPGGLWIHHVVARVLEDGDDHLRQGYCLEVVNSRGVHWVDPSGAPEDGLAEVYDGRAKAVEECGYYSFGAALRRVAESYRIEAAEIRSRENRLE